MNIKDLEPKAVFKYFSEICEIPHGSLNTKQLADYCVGFARARGLECICDKAGNVIIYKNGTKGKENSSPVILQGHLDMVCEKVAECTKDMAKEGIDVITDGEYVWADGTTLGADDGIALAYMLAILDSDDIAHPPIEALFTVDEEIGLLGAAKVNPAYLNGTRLINIDSEKEGILTASCAGGVRVQSDIPLTSVALKEGLSVMELSVSGLLGGHSGIDIDKHRKNANVVLAKLLNRLERLFRLNILSFDGGTRENVIASSAKALIACAENDTERLISEVAHASTNAAHDNRSTEPNIKLSCVKCENGSAYGEMYDEASTKRIIFALMQAPDAIQTMSPDIPGMVQTSMNMGRVFTDKNALTMKYLVRSNAATGKQKAVEKLTAFVEYLGAKVSINSDYPAWEYKMYSPLRDIMVKVYREFYDDEPQILSIHAGLECGILASKIADIDMISIGPDLEQVHTPKERMGVASAARCYQYLVKVLENLD